MPTAIGIVRASESSTYASTRYAGMFTTMRIGCGPKRPAIAHSQGPNIDTLRIDTFVPLST
jgi:hypothetical protein